MPTGASAFTTDRGTTTTGDAVTTLPAAGTAKYNGGAAGKYALHSATGGINDAGHFTARATIDADFKKMMVSGRIDQFTGADGESREWTVDLLEVKGVDSTTIADGMTQWTIGEKAADKAGSWKGELENMKDGRPSVATGTFYATYGSEGAMAGGFGATIDD